MKFLVWEIWSTAIYHDLGTTVFRSDPLRKIVKELRTGNKTWHTSNSFLSEKGPISLKSMTFSWNMLMGGIYNLNDTSKFHLQGGGRWRVENHTPTYPRTHPLPSTQYAEEWESSICYEKRVCYVAYCNIFRSESQLKISISEQTQLWPLTCIPT